MPSQRLDFHSGHAHLIFGDTSGAEKHIQSFIDTLDNPEVYRYRVATTKISHIRDIQDRVSKTARGEMVVVLSTSSMVLAAQHAFLKTLEEAPTGVTYILIIPHGTHVIETVLSRVVSHELSIQEVHDISLFLAMKYTEREDFFTGFLGEDEKYRKEEVTHFLRDLIRHLLREKLLHSEDLKSIKELSEYVFDVSSNIKHILAYIALMVPVIQSS